MGKLFHPHPLIEDEQGIDLTDPNSVTFTISSNVITEYSSNPVNHKNSTYTVALETDGNNPDIARAYRQSFVHYNQERLLVSTTYYAVAAGFFFGIFLVRYRMELLLATPFLAGFIAWYIHIGLQEDSPVQYPEYLYKEIPFMAYTGFCVLLLVALMFVDVPFLGDLFAPTIHVPAR